MKYRPLKSHEVIKALNQLGFEDRGGTRHAKFYRPASGTLITIPRERELSPNLLRAIVKQVVGRGDATEDSIESKLFGF